VLSYEEGSGADTETVQPNMNKTLKENAQPGKIVVYLHQLFAFKSTSASKVHSL
jgi:hypothetical protein